MLLSFLPGCNSSLLKGPPSPARKADSPACGTPLPLSAWRGERGVLDVARRGQPRKSGGDRAGLVGSSWDQRRRRCRARILPSRRWLSPEANGGTGVVLTENGAYACGTWQA